MLKTNFYCTDENIKELISNYIDFSYIDSLNVNNEKNLEKYILIKLITSIYKNKPDKLDDLKILIKNLLDNNKYIYNLSNFNIEKIQKNFKNIFNNKIDLSITENKIFNIYKNLSKVIFTNSYKFDLILKTYFILKEITEKNFNSSLNGKIFITSGFGDIGLSLSQAVKYLGGISIVIDVNPYLIRQRQEEGFCDYVFEDFYSAFDFAFSYKKEKQSKIIALLGNGSEIINKILDEGFLPDILTDSTNTDLDKYFPAGYDYYDAIRINKVDNHHSKNISKHSVMMLVKAMLELQKRGTFVFEFSNNFRQVAFNRGLENAFSIKDIENIIFNHLSKKNKYYKILNLSEDKENIFLINDSLYQDFLDNEDIKISSEIFMSLSNQDIDTYFIKLDKNKIYFFINKINNLINSKEIQSPLLLSNYIFEKNDYINKDNQYLFEINYIFDNFKINEKCLIINGNNSF